VARPDPIRFAVVGAGRGRSFIRAAADPSTGVELVAVCDRNPLWREHREEAAAAGHGGGDFFLLREFAGAVREQRSPLIDVYDAVTWSSITPLSVQSLSGGGVPVPVPDFCSGKS